MGECFINYDKLISSADILNSLDDNVKSNKSEIEKIVNDLKKIGSNHEDCLSSLNASSLTSEVDKTSSSIITIIKSVKNTVAAYSAVEAFSIKESADADRIKTSGIKIKSVGLSNALGWLLTLSDKDNSLSKKVNDKDIQAGYPYEKYNKQLNDILSCVSGSRNKAAVTGIYMTTIFPHLPYFWGGKYLQKGMNPDWGKDKKVTAKDNETTGTIQKYSLDCSGYVSWVLLNSGYNITEETNAKGLQSYGNVENINASGVSDRVQIGDLVTLTKPNDEGEIRTSHVGIIVGKNKDDILVSHCTQGGGGLNYVKIDTKTGKVVEDSSNKHNGEVYFTEVVELDYKD